MSPTTMPDAGSAAHTNWEIRARMRRGAYSTIKATKQGDAPPSPSPVMKRIAVSCPNEAVNGTANVPSTNTSVDRMRMRRRPQRSAHGPRMSAPASDPHCAADRIGPIVDGGRWNSAVMSGAVTPIANPS